MISRIFARVAHFIDSLYFIHIEGKAESPEHLHYSFLDREHIDYQLQMKVREAQLRHVVRRMEDRAKKHNLETPFDMGLIIK